MTESLSPIFSPQQIAAQDCFSCLPCLGGDFCGRLYEWIDSCLMASTTVLAVMGLAIAFFAAQSELVVCFGLITLITAYLNYSHCQSSDDQAIEQDATELEVVDEHLGQQVAE